MNVSECILEIVDHLNGNLELKCLETTLTHTKKSELSSKSEYFASHKKFPYSNYTGVINVISRIQIAFVSMHLRSEHIVQNSKAPLHLSTLILYTGASASIRIFEKILHNPDSSGTKKNISGV